MSDLTITLDDNDVTATVEGTTEDGESFADSWVLGVLSVEDLGRITVTSEVLGELRAAASGLGLTTTLKETR